LIVMRHVEITDVEIKKQNLNCSCIVWPRHPVL